jgi:hypothetical protein
LKKEGLSGTRFAEPSAGLPWCVCVPSFEAGSIHFVSTTTCALENAALQGEQMVCLEETMIAPHLTMLATALEMMNLIVLKRPATTIGWAFPVPMRL